MRKPRIYLAGAIRDGNKYDIQWREQVAGHLREFADIINPMARKKLDEGLWKIGQVPITSRMIVKNDFWALEHVDAVLFNFTALAEGYPNIGSLIEFGYAASKRLLMWAILSPTYRGHDNPQMYHLHPFIEENIAVRFDTALEAIEYLQLYLPVMAGKATHYGQ